MELSTHKFAWLTIALVCTIYASIGVAHDHGRVPPTYVLAELSDDEVKDRIIQESIARYPGNCPCPFNVDRAGRQCGGRSAWSKPGAAAPLCFREDVSEEMIKEWRGNSG